MMLLYRLLSFLALPLFWAVVAMRHFNGRDEPAAWKDRIGIAPYRPVDDTAPLIWCHAASVGEAQTMLPLLSALLAARPDLQAIVTTVTRTGAEVVRAANLPRTAHQFVPFDHPLWVGRFVSILRPTCAVFTDSELWPNLLTAARMATKGRVVLLNARLSERSAKRWQSFAGFFRALMGHFALILPQDKTNAERLSALGVHDVAYHGNLKLCRPPLPADAAALNDWRTRLRTACPIILFASTHEGEEAMAIRIHNKLRAEFPALGTVIVPRHPARADAITAPDGVHIVGQLGILGVFYRLADVAIIGNSFGTKPGGGHNPFEAVQLDCPVLFGPDMANFTDLARDMVAAGTAIQVTSEDELYAALRQPGYLAAMRTKARDFVQSQNSTLEATLAAVLKYIA